MLFSNDGEHQKIAHSGVNSATYVKGVPLCVGCGKKLINYKSKRCMKCYKLSRKGD